MWCLPTSDDGLALVAAAQPAPAFAMVAIVLANPLLSFFQLPWVETLFSTALLPSAPVSVRIGYTGIHPSQSPISSILPPYSTPVTSVGLTGLMTATP
ncbi:hypothetical protein EDB81DRAFT_883975 [Dactylonectria macrodidyma]|uniref:Uncharacterized protein n=1 Tax=Dactylonectria macrodidyma TaxID=307937 RepID=A0A9P9EWH4_9HYPO|nr:hypothetical protein EDB81DRAFT_883975 [Dactylonectria macrodidyma]